MALTGTYDVTGSYSATAALGCPDGLIAPPAVPDYSIPFAGVYVQVLKVDTMNVSGSATAVVRIFADSTMQKLIRTLTYDFTIDVSDTGKNPIKQAYEYLKTQPEYAGFADVLEAGQTA